MSGKSLFGSRTFWLNILGAVGMVASSGVIPIKYSAPTLAVANIGLRMLTNEPITSLLPQDDSTQISQGTKK